MASSDVTLSFGANISDFNAAMVNIRQSVRQSVNVVNQEFTSVQTVIQQAAESAKLNWTEVGANFSVLAGNALKFARSFAGFASGPLREFSRFEDAATRLAPLTGGLEKAKALCEALRDEAANGTMSFEQLASVAGRLATVFKSADDVRRWTTAFHDLSAGTGLDVNELVGNFVRSRASGRFEAGLMDMFAQKGVNIFPELVKQTGESETALRKMAAAGTLAFSEVEKAILAVSTGTGQFAGQAAKLSNTFGGSVATMVANWKILQAKMAEPVAEALTPALQKISALMSENAGQYAATGLAAAQLSAPLLGLAAAVKMTSGALNAFGASALAAKAQSAGLAAGIVGAVAALGTAAYVNSLNKMENAADALARANRRLGDSFAAMDAAKTREEFDAAKKTALELLDFLDEKGVELRARAGMSGGGVNTFAARETIQIAEERKAAELDKAAALEKAALAERRLAEAAAEAAEISKKAAQSRQEVEAAEKARADARALNAADARERPGKLLEQAGYANADALDFDIDMKRSGLTWDEALGRATPEQVEELRRVVELRERYADLLDAAKKSETDAQTRLDKANAAYERRKALLDAELSGNAKLAEQLKAQNRARELAAQYEAQGMDADTARERAKEMTTLERAADAAGKAADAGGGATRVGAGTVGTAQASVGGGRAVNIGMSGAISVAREQLSAARQMLAALNKIVTNTEKNGAAAAILA